MNKDQTTKVVHHDSSLSAFMTGAIIGAVAALMLGTEEGRKLSQKLSSTAKDLSKNMEPELNSLAQKAKTMAEDIQERAHQMTPLPPELKSEENTHERPQFFNQSHPKRYSQGPTFTQNGRNL